MPIVILFGGRGDIPWNCVIKEKITCTFNLFHVFDFKWEDVMVFGLLTSQLKLQLGGYQNLKDYTMKLKSEQSMGMLTWNQNRVWKKRKEEKKERQKSLRINYITLFRVLENVFSWLSQELRGAFPI